MTSQSPRIYIYKITFEEVLYYYYGIHKERKFDEYYTGSPVTHKWMWDFYTPKKQILEVFSFTDEGWLEAREVEKRLIKPFYNTDKWCLNESCGGSPSLKYASIGGTKAKELGLGVHGLTPEQRTQNGKIGGKNSSKLRKELKVGIFGITPEQRIENGRKGGNKSKENKTGAFSLTREEKSEIAKKFYELGFGIGGLTPEQLSEYGRKGGSISGKENYILCRGAFSLTREERLKVVKKTNSQKWMCLQTGYITTSGALTNYQRKRGIDTSKRKRIE
jgi:hypothetical protein